MNAKEKYGHCTEEGCRVALGNLFGLDNNITIGQLRKFLEKRINDANKEFTKSKELLMKQLVGKCLLLSFDEQHSVLLKIDSVNVVNKYGSPEALITGEKITSYKGQIDYKRLKEEEYSKFYTENKTPVAEEYFNYIKEQFQSIQF